MKDVVRMVLSWAGVFINSPIVKGISIFVIEPDDDGKQKIIARIENINGDIIAANEWKIRYDPAFLEKFFGGDPGETKKIDGKNAVYKFIPFEQAEGILSPEKWELGVLYTQRGNTFCEAEEWAKAAADFGEAVRLNSSNAAYFLNRGYAFYKSGDYNQAVADFTKSLELHPNDENTKNLLADAYNKRGKTFCKAEEWAKAAADFDEAIRLDSSDASYFYNRGFVHEASGESGKAVADYVKAAEMGNEEAMIMLGLLYRYGLWGTEDEDEAKGAEWYRKAAEQGNASGQYELGDCYMDGAGVPKDEAKGAEWYRKAAEQGDGRAQGKLGYCYENGVGLPVDMAKALEWRRKAAARGYATSQFALGRFYRDGLGVSVDIAQARSWFEKAAAQGIEEAQAALAEMVGASTSAFCLP